MNDSGQGDKTQQTQDQERTIAEWITLGLSIVIVASTIGALTWLYIVGGEMPPTVTVEPQMNQLRQEDSGYYLPVVVTNEGDTTVSGVTILAELETGPSDPERSEFVISFLAGGATVEGAFIFQTDPTQGELTTTAANYQIP